MTALARTLPSMLIDFAGYAADCRVSGLLMLNAERLSDMLNHSSSVTVHDVTLESLDDGRVVELPRVTLDRDELYAVTAAGPRGPEARRIHTVRHRLEIKLGPYSVLGQLHTMPGAPPLASVGRRGPLVPLTASTIAYVTGGALRMEDATTLIVNRSVAEWVRATPDEALAFPGVPIRPAAAVR